MSTSMQENILFGGTVFLCVCALMFGGLKGCAIDAETMRSKTGQITAAKVECIKQGYTPLDCTNALDK